MNEIVMNKTVMIKQFWLVIFVCTLILPVPPASSQETGEPETITQENIEPETQEDIAEEIEENDSVFGNIFSNISQRRKERRRREKIHENIATKAEQNNFGYYIYHPRLVEPIDFSSLYSVFAERFTSIKSFSENDLVLTASLEPTVPEISELSLSLMARPDIGKAVLQHYKASPKFLWLDADLRPSVSAKFIEQVFNEAHRYGLHRDDYFVAPLGKDSLGNEKAILNYELSLTLRAIRYILDARHGIALPKNISSYHDLGSPNQSIKKIMKSLANSESPATLLLESHPASSEFLLLQRELWRLGAAEPQAKINGVDTNTIIYPGDEHEKLSTIIDQLENIASVDTRIKFRSILSDVDSSTTLYSLDLVDFVQAVQKEKRLTADGVIGPLTMLELFPQASRLSRVEEKRQKILLAMERLRWLPNELGENYVMINSPAYNVSIKNGEKVALSMRTIVGSLYHQTNMFQDEIEYVEFNPYWGVPQSIIFDEFLPELLENPAYLDEEGYEIFIGNERKNSVDVDWHTISRADSIYVRQPPGPNNALGSLKIMFPNKHAIYMHDTPQRQLFDKRDRAFSHGCIRLQYPLEMAAKVLGKTVAEVNEYIENGENERVMLKNKLPVYVSYFTAWPNENGKIEYHEDIYARDNALSKAMRLERAARQI